MGEPQLFAAHARTADEDEPPPPPRQRRAYRRHVVGCTFCFTILLIMFVSFISGG